MSGGSAGSVGDRDGVRVGGIKGEEREDCRRKGYRGGVDTPGHPLGESY